MSNISSKLHKTESSVLLSIKVEIDTNVSYDKCMIEFRHKGTTMEIISAISGGIQNNKIILHKDIKSTASFVQYDQTVDEFDCILSYLVRDELIHYEALKENITSRPTLVAAPASVSTLRSTGDGYDNKMSNFMQMLHGRVSPKYRLRVRIDSDIIIESSAPPIYITFGECCPDIRTSDLIFKIDRSIVIPKEIFWKKYDEYRPNASIGCCEIIKADFHSAPNTFYKSRTSNTLRLSDFPRIYDKKIEYFTTPTGVLFDNQWTMTPSMMPVYKEQ